MAWMTFAPWVSSIGLTVVAVAYEPMIQSLEYWQWSIFFLATIITMGIAITPTTFIALLSGYFLGMDSLLFVVICYQLASLIGYQIAGVVDHDLIRLIVSKFPKSKGIFNNVSSNQWLTTMMARISPALPFGLMNVVLSVTGIKRLPFFIGGLIGMLPRTAFFIWLGAQAPLLNTALQSQSNLIWTIGLTVLMFFGLYFLLRPKKAKKEDA